LVYCLVVKLLLLSCYSLIRFYDNIDDVVIYSYIDVL